MEEAVGKGGAIMIKDNATDREEFVRPATPEIREEKRKDKDGGSDSHKQPRLPGKKRHRRAKGKRKKQKTCLMITNDDGTHSTTSQEPAQQQRKVCLRPSNNPLLKAPKNSTQYIIDDHENSNLFVDFGDERSNESTDPDPDMGQYFGLNDADRLSPDDDNFFTEYAERDFESVYATAHQEEVSSWEREKIIEEIALMERRQKQLVEVLSTIDPTVYLQKLQHELLSLQEVNRQLKLRNIAERLERQQIRDRRGMAISRHSSPRLPDSTSNVGEDDDGSDSSTGSSSSGSSSSSSSGSSSASSSSTESDGDSDGGGCSSGCCLADDCNDCDDKEPEEKEEGKEGKDEKEEEGKEEKDVKGEEEKVDKKVEEGEGKADRKEKSDASEKKEAVEKGGEDAGDGIDEG